MIEFILVFAGVLLVPLLWSVCIAVYRNVANIHHRKYLRKKGIRSVDLSINEAVQYVKILQSKAASALSETNGRKDVRFFERYYFDSSVRFSWLTQYVRFLMKVDRRIVFVRGKHFCKVLKYIKELEDNEF